MAAPGVMTRLCPLAWSRALEVGSHTVDTSLRLLAGCPLNSLTRTTPRLHTGTLPSPQNAMCYSGQNVAGNLIANTESVSDSVACANLCITVPGCSYSVFRAGGLTGNGR
jgi:hypothetical protein